MELQGCFGFGQPVTAAPRQTASAKLYLCRCSRNINLQIEWKLLPCTLCSSFTHHQRMCQAFFESAIAKGGILVLPPTDREPSRFAALGQAQKDRVFAVRLSGPTCCGRGPSAVCAASDREPSRFAAGSLARRS